MYIYWDYPSIIPVLLVFLFSLYRVKNLVNYSKLKIFIPLKDNLKKNDLFYFFIFIFIKLFFSKLFGLIFRVF